ncbi:uncharacterized protein LOC113289878 isoform X2 [Papaver somniferum]|uniref:uncharacterized protein LOC113289878 isoform X2 n=1 Tax=Papaver somniferum TaxID=3469 RepID=UPI000E702E56|nr:uncharacterized protein LOC113289878 isoform X2 [Papaver somniferum]XP_026395089.1 uncharacterized protein LOC113289878 isoform X2 [Papaver somniferum]XP_026395090.1 uncharacterized protein LOC113289878 isoform X2 [Papaver somniferum]
MDESTIENQKNGTQPSSTPEVFTILSKVVSGAEEGRRFTSEESTRGASGYAEPSHRNSDRKNYKGGHQTPDDGGHCSFEKPAEPSVTSNSADTRSTGLEYIFGQSPTDCDSINNFTFKLDTLGSGGVSKSGKGRTRLRVKDVARCNNSGGGISSNGGYPSSCKKPKRSVEVRDALYCSFGPGNVLPTEIQDQAHSIIGAEQSSGGKEDGIHRGPSRFLSVPNVFKNLSMKILVWNYRGAARPSFTRVMRKLIKRHKPNIVALLETRVLASHAVGIVRHLGYEESILVDPEGFSGGICLLWNPEEVDIQATKRTRWALHAVVSVKSKSPWILSTIYRSTNKSNKRTVWNELQTVSDISNSDWMVMGDLNVIGSCQEKKGGRNPSHSKIAELREVMDSCGLIDLGFNGPKYTWNNKRVGAANIKERLDRAVANSNWINRFSKAQVTHLSYFISDHRAILIDLELKTRFHPRPFRFEAMWAEDPRYSDVVKNNWNTNTDGNVSGNFFNNISKIQLESKKWNKHVFGDIQTQIDVAQDNLRKAQNDFDSWPSDSAKIRMNDCLIEYLRLLKLEETFWR